MSEATVPAEIDWRPFWVTGALLLAALVLDVWAGNRLWLAYTSIGLALLLVVAGGVRHLGWRPPTVAAWTVGLAAAMHYLGGSLSGLHQIGGVNGLYYAFPWWDNLTHFLGLAAVAVAVYAALVPRLSAGRLLTGFLAVSVACLIGILIELYELAGFLFFGTVDQGFYLNNALDLYYNLLGAVTGVVVYARWLDPEAS